MMSVSEFFSSDPEPPWIVDVAADLESYTDIHTQNEASTSASPPSSISTRDSENRSVTDMEIDIPSTSSESGIDRVIAHFFTLREIESVRPFRIEDRKGSTGGAGWRAASRSKASRKRKFRE